MKTLKIIFGTLGSILSMAIAGVLVWGLLYLCIPPVKDWTNEHVFKTEITEEENKDATTNEDENTDDTTNEDDGSSEVVIPDEDENGNHVQTIASINFRTGLIRIGV